MAERDLGRDFVKLLSAAGLFVATACGAPTTSAPIETRGLPHEVEVKDTLSVGETTILRFPVETGGTINVFLTLTGVGPGETPEGEPDAASFTGMPTVQEGDPIIIQKGGTGIWLEVGRIEEIDPSTGLVDITIYDRARVVDKPEWAD